jgi:hypothetical protein
MAAREYDRVWWAPISSDGMDIPGLVHRCHTAVLIASTTRAQLDPMALGTCRYCDEMMPVHPEGGAT